MSVCGRDSGCERGRYARRTLFEGSPPTQNGRGSISPYPMLEAGHLLVSDPQTSPSVPGQSGDSQHQLLSGMFADSVRESDSRA